MEPPTREAHRLSLAHAAASLVALQDAVDAGEPIAFEHNYEIHRPNQVDAAACALGIPLLASLSDDATAAAVEMIVAAPRPKLNPERPRLAEKLTRYLFHECVLWEIAAAYGGPSARIPWAFTFYALEWFWDPVAHVGPTARALCLRCGKLHRKKKHAKGMPCCPHCAKESPTARRWPDRAVMPADRGRWWLRCWFPDCTAQPFHARANRRYCDEHDRSKTTPSRRLPRTT